MDEIPSLLLTVPAPHVEEAAIDGKVLSLTIQQAEEYFQEYKEAVQNYCRAAKPSFAVDVVPALEFGLRLFNAENFIGELSPAERNEFSSVLLRFEQQALKVEAQEGEDNEEQDTISKHTDPHEAYLQRLLTVDGEMPSPCLKLSGLLLCLVAIVSARLEDGSALVPYDSIWRLRVHYRHQIVLKHRAHGVFVPIAACIDALCQKTDQEVTVGELLEVSYAQNYYHRRELAEETVKRAVKKSGLRVKECCMEGVRTRWQEHQLPQLLMQAEGTRSLPAGSDEEEQPVTVMGEKDGHDLLDRPREKPESQPVECVPLHPEDKALLLLMSDHIAFHNPHHSLTTHRMCTYVERLLVDTAPTPYVLRSYILLARSRLEARRNRVQERAFMQMTELVDQFSSRRDVGKRTFQRTKTPFFYAIPYPSWWDLKKEYADFCFEENLFKTALAMYEEIQDWEKIIECCKKLDKRRRAESLARELLETDPKNPMLWVALGEATRRDEHLWTAWELAGHKMAAPMRALARLALDRERYEDVIKFFDAAVKINPIFGGDWFSLGFACLKMKNWDRSGEAFTRVCQMDPNDAYAWNNLGSIMMRRNKKRPAFNAISQGLRQNRRDWRMWQNYFSIGCELKEVTETTNALHIALGIAKRQLVLERSTLELFVDNTIAYLKGEIPGMSSESQESDEVHEADQVRYKSMTLNDNCTSDDAIPHVAAAAEEAEVELSDLVPFGADLPLPAGSLKKDSEDKQQIAKCIRIRHRHRVRALFLKIMDTFVNDPDIYFCAAKLVHYLDGPLAAYAYKSKELCVCHQKDQWEQENTSFQRTIEALETTADILKDAYRVASDVAAGRCPAELIPDPEAKADENYLDLLEKAAFSPTPSEHIPGIATISTGSEKYAKAVLLSLKDTLNNVQRTVVATEPHFAGTEGFQRLTELLKSVKRTFQEAKDEFDL
eukprot:gene11109-7735_t